MPFFLVYDPPDAHGPYLIGQAKGSRDKTFDTLWRAQHRLRTVGTTVRSMTKIWQFNNLADATSHCVHVREQRWATATSSRSPSLSAQPPSEPTPPAT